MSIVRLPRYEEFPEIDLYADQVISYLNTHLEFFQLDETKPIITGTMINNYVKQKVIPRPEKKKYNRDHIGYLFVICILKNVYSISEIADLLMYQATFAENAQAYNRFCVELETCIEHSFNQQNPPIAEERSAGSKLLCQVTTSISHKLFVEKVINKYKKEHPVVDSKKKRK